MTRQTIGQFTINYEPSLEFATVTVQGILAPEVVHSEDGPQALEKCAAWAEEQNGGKK